MINVKQALGIHEMVVKQFGGSMGVRDAGGLESALARPFQTFGGEDLYPDLFSKAAAIGESKVFYVSEGLKLLRQMINCTIS